MKQKIANFMYGRYGNDQLNRALSVLILLLLIVSFFFGFSETGSTARSFLLVIVLALLIYTYFRMLSKNLSARRAENAKFLAKTARLRDWWQLRRDMWNQRKEYKFFKCPSCKAVMRVPKGKGKIRIICKKCGTAFEKNT
ncbi:MAG: hypothetical protein ACI3UZ_03845 [Oscillospiraceae bacterium]|nr:hypothetical protein [Oscillospiraceae bacterium]